jgi:hypothetical protein
MKINLQTFRDMAAPEDPTKIGRVLHRLCCGEDFNRFEAEIWLHDHALNSTISTLANVHRIEILRTPEVVPGYRRKPTRCHRYRIDATPANLARCYWLLMTWGYRVPADGRPAPDDGTPPEAA